MLSLARRVQRRLGGLYNAGILEENSGGHEHLTLFTEKVGAFISSVVNFENRNKQPNTRRIKVILF